MVLSMQQQMRVFVERQLATIILTILSNGIVATGNWFSGFESQLIAINSDGFIHGTTVHLMHLLVYSFTHSQ
jgi:hypothetical protein